MRVIVIVIASMVAASGLLGTGAATAEDPLRCPAGMTRNHPNQGIAIPGGVSGQLFLCNGPSGAASGGATEWAAAFLIENDGLATVTLGVSGRKSSDGWQHDKPETFGSRSAGDIIYSSVHAVPPGRQVQPVIHVGPAENNRQYGAAFSSTP